MNDRQNYTLDIIGRIDEDIIDNATEYCARMRRLAQSRRRRGIVGLSAIAAALVLVVSVLLVIAPFIFNTGTPSYIITGVERLPSADGVESYRIIYSDGATATFTVEGGSGDSAVTGVSKTDKGEMLISLGSGNTLNLGNYIGERSDGNTRDTNVKGVTIDKEGAMSLSLVNHSEIGLGEVHKDRGDDNLTISMARISDDGELVLGFASGATINLGRVVGKDGKDGAGISYIQISDSGELIITLTDRTEINLGRVRGEDGVGVAKSEINEAGELCLTYTNGAFVNLGRVRGENGKDGRSAYEIYKDKYGYDGTESEWIDDLANGRLGALQKYSVYFNTGTSVSVDTQEVIRGGKVEKPTDPTRPGYTFRGWYVDDEKWSFSGSSVTEDITLVARWEIITYPISYSLGGGSNSGYNPTSYTVEKEISLEKPSRRGYSFDGWYSNSGFTSPVEKITKGSTGELVLYAKWTAISYPITYHPDGGTLNAPGPSSYTVESSFSLPTPTKEHYAFVGWCIDEGCTTPISSVAPGMVGELSFYAKWADDNYTITYRLCGGSSRGDNPESYTYGSQFDFNEPVRAGYNFSAGIRTRDITTESAASTRRWMGISQYTPLGKWLSIP